MNPFQQPQFYGSTGSILSGAFGNSDKPYSDAGNKYEEYGNKAIDVQNPFYQAGLRGLSGYEDWLSGMKDPADFINNLMGGYSESAYAKNLTQQAMRAGTNAASASGLTGSTPFAMQMEQTAGGIASQDMDKWLKQVLGINSQYGAGERSLAGMGQHSADQMSRIYNDMGRFLAEMQYGEGAANNRDRGNLIGGGLSLLSLLMR